MAAPAAFTNTTLHSEVLSCPSRLAEITVRLSDLQGVTSVEVVFPAAHVLVIHDPVTVTVDDLAAVIAELGHGTTPGIIDAA